MMYVWGHSFEFDNNDNWEVIEEFCEMIGGQDDIWYATNIEIVDYLETFDRLQFAADLSFVYNPSAASCWLAVDGDTHKEIPVSIVLGGNGAKAEFITTARKGDQAVYFDINSYDKIMSLHLNDSILIMEFLIHQCHNYFYLILN